MADETANLILEYKPRFEKTLGDMRADLSDLREGQQEINRRLSHVEEGQAILNRRLDRLDERITRIEKRLDLVEG
jgi:predicted  nucleic acid-binding Zn-ribbon protein